MMRASDAAAASMRGHAKAVVTGNLARDLAVRQANGQPIRIGLIGSGEMGTDIVSQCRQMAGVTVAAIAEINIASAKRAIEIAEWPESSAVMGSSPGAIDRALK